jgi:hypothetical protein
MGNNSSDDARLAYDFLEPVTLQPAILAMHSRGARNLRRGFDPIAETLGAPPGSDKVWQMIDEFLFSL